MASKRVRFAKDAQRNELEQQEGNVLKRSRTKARNEADDDEDAGGDGEPKAVTSTKRAKKHTLDSDEEDEADAYEKLDMDKVDGQEEATLEYEGQVKIMPFNMKEDLEEGHFDADGTFIFDDKKEAIKDAWLDNIEWDNVKNAAGKNWGKLDDEQQAGEEASEKSVDLRSVYSRLHELLKEKDTVTSVLKRLNNEKGLSAKEERKRRWAAKKTGGSVQEDEKSKLVAELTSLADSLVSTGVMEAYQLDQANIKERLDGLEPQSAGAKEATVDMFSD